MSKSEFADRLLCWHDQHGRKNLPWQQTTDPYRIWVSEIMLQQTQVTTVIDYYERFIQRFPNIGELARAPVDDVLTLWSGLGYYARARNLHKTACIIAQQYDGHFPKSIDQVMALPGIGRSTAGAILAFSDNQRLPILDGNVKRVLCRYYAIEGFPGNKQIENKLWLLADKNTPDKNVAQYTQAIMDLGATVCSRKNPSCDCCPFIHHCQAKDQDRVNVIPGSRPKKTLPSKSITMALVQNNKGEILLEKRPMTGLWGGLWSLPECSIEQDMIEFCKHSLGINVNQTGCLSPLKHSFSHYHLNIEPKCFTAKKIFTLKEDNLNWFKLENVHQLGLPKPVKSLLSQLETHHE